MSDDPSSENVVAGRPVVRLRPQARGRGAAAPWAYADEVVMDRRTRGIAAGAVVALQDAERRPLGAAAFNAGSKIAVRMLDTDLAATVDAGLVGGAAAAGAGAQGGAV